MASTWHVGFSALMMALKSCSTFVGGKRRKFDGEGHQLSAFFSLPHTTRKPFVKNGFVKSPASAELSAWNPSIFCQVVDGSNMDVKIQSSFFGCQNLFHKNVPIDR